MEGQATVSASQMILGVKLRDDARFDNFLGDRNAEACERVKAICENAAGVPVVVVCGDADTGKSHLLQAACHRTEQQGKTAVCVSMEELLPFGPEALAGLEHQHLICIDDVDLIAGREEWEEAVFHLYNRVLDNGHLFIVSLSEVPASSQFVLADLVSRLSHGLLVQLGIYRDDDRLKILMTRAEQRGLVMGDDVAGFILRRAPRKLGELLAILDRLDENSLQAQRRLTIPFVKSVMGW